MDISSKIILTSLLFAALSLSIMSLCNGEEQELLPEWLIVAILLVFGTSVVGLIFGALIKIWL